jgi:hypothetical protein
MVPRDAQRVEVALEVERASPAEVDAVVDVRADMASGVESGEVLRDGIHVHHRVQRLHAGDVDDEVEPPEVGELSQVAPDHRVGVEQQERFVGRGPQAKILRSWRAKRHMTELDWIDVVRPQERDPRLEHVIGRAAAVEDHADRRVAHEPADARTGPARPVEVLRLRRDDDSEARSGYAFAHEAAGYRAWRPVNGV